MSLGYLEHSRTRYLRNHYEIFDYRKEKEAEKATYEAGRAQREAALEARQQERREALEALIEANRVYTPSSRLTQEIEEEARQKRIEKERAREQKAKAAADRQATEKFKSRLSGRAAFHSHLTSVREERTARLERQAQYNKIDRDRRAKEREAKSWAKSGRKDDSDSDDEKIPTRSTRTTSTRAPIRSTVSSNRLVSKYRDLPESSRRASRRTAEEPVAESSTSTSSAVRSSSSKSLEASAAE